MRKKHLLFLITMLVVSYITNAQHRHSNSTLSLSGGLNAISSEDGIQHPRKYSGTTLSFNSMYTRTAGNGQHAIDLTYSSGDMHTAGYPEAKSRLIFLNYDYLFNIGKRERKLTSSLGVGVHTIMDHIDYLPGIPSTQRYFSSAGSFLAVSGNITYRLGERSSIKLQVGLPVLGVISRPGESFGGKKLTSVVFVNESVLFSAKLEYCYQLTSKIGLLASYRYDHFQYAGSRPHTVANKGLFVGLRVSL